MMYNHEDILSLSEQEVNDNLKCEINTIITSANVFLSTAEMQFEPSWKWLED